MVSERPPAKAKNIRVDAYIDLVCPWCFIGMRRLAKALAARPDVSATVNWHPYFLNRETPDREQNFRLYMERKIGGSLRLERLFHTIQEIGTTVDICFDFNAIPCLPSTLKAHALLRHAHHDGLQTALLSALFEAYFCHGAHIGQEKTLFSIAEKIGITNLISDQIFENTELNRQIIADVDTAHRIGNSGIPLFIFQNRFQMTGAHDPNVLARLIDVSTAFSDINFSLSGSPLHQQYPLTFA